jgi:hypothetical protein
MLANAVSFSPTFEHFPECCHKIHRKQWTRMQKVVSLNPARPDIKHKIGIKHKIDINLAVLVTDDLCMNACLCVNAAVLVYALECLL